MRFMPPVPPMPPMPMPGVAPWGWPGRSEEVKDQWDDFMADVEAFWEQQRDIQKSSVKAAKKWWSAFFG